MLPLTLRILDGIGAGLSTWFGKVKLAADVDQLSELAEDREQYVGAGFDVLRVGELPHVVADAIDARDEDHCRRAAR